MLGTIENEYLKVSVSSNGAEFSSIINKKNGIEYLWQGDEKYWPDRAPILFPVCGRLYGFKYFHDGKEYEIGLHGFYGLSHYEIVENTATTVTFLLHEDDETLKIYPFRFNLFAKFSLFENCINVDFTVVNRGEYSMIFSIGAHPGFNVPLAENEVFEDYYIDFGSECHPEIIHNFHDGSPFEKYPLKDGKTIPLFHSVFDEDGLFLKNTTGFAAIRSRKSDRAVEVSYHGFKYVGIWHWPETDAPYVCIEPWYSLPLATEVKSLEDYEGLITLEKGKEYNIGYKIAIK